MNAVISFTGGSTDAVKDGFVGSVGVNAGDLRIRAATTTPGVLGGPTSLSDLSLSFSLEKPASFIIDYDVPTRDVRFQFMNRVRVMEKQLSMTYTHSRRTNETAVDAGLALDPANKLWASYAFGSGDCRVRYSFTHGGNTTFEPCYDTATNSWDVSVSRRILDGDVVRAYYRNSDKVLGLEMVWQGMNRDGRFKVSASMNLAEGSKLPKLKAESTWNFEM